MSVTKELGRKVLNNNLIETDNGYVMDFDDLEIKAKDPKTKIMILCSPHNPVGRVWTENELQRIIQICTENDVLIISDEIHQDLVHKGHRHIPTARLALENTKKIITCTAPSKTFNVASLFASNIIISDNALREAFKKELDKLHQMPSPFTIQAVIASYNESEDWLNELLNYLSDNIDFVQAYFERELPKVKMRKPEATFLLWLDFREYGISSRELERIIIEDAQLALNKGWMFGRNGEGHMRLNIGCPRDILSEALDRIRDAFEDMA